MSQMRQKRSLLLVVAMGALVAAAWLFVLLLAPRQQSLDVRAHNLEEQLKCPVCQAESVADSPSWVAQQLRVDVRQQMQAGQSNQQIVQYLQQRYGNQLVWSPPWQGFSLLIWLAPIALLAIGLLLIGLTTHDWRALTRASATARPTRVEDATTRKSGAEDEEMWRYRQQLIEELADADPLFERYRTEAQ